MKTPLNENHNRLVAIVGPTAVGKTETAIRFAEAVGGEIVSTDSRLFYRGMDIGTAKPSLEERQRVPHHLIDVANPDQTWSLSVFQQEAKRVIAEIQARGALPVLVGGTGQYVYGVIQGWEMPAQEPHERLRAVIEQMGHEMGRLELHRRLALIDPEAAAHIEATNLRRTVRALEVIFLTGRRFSEQRKKGGSPYHLLMLGLIRPREELYRRIDERIDVMFANGFVQEVQGLLDAGYRADLPTMSAIGYREVTAYLRGEMPMEDVVMLMKRATREYVRRQANWFKESDPAIHWFQAGQNPLEGMLRVYEEEEAWIPAEI